MKNGLSTRTSATVIGLTIAASLIGVAAPALAVEPPVKAGVLTYPIPSNYTFNGRCPSGFSWQNSHLYYDREANAPLLGFHAGRDLNGVGCDDTGADLRAIGNGIVLFAGSQGSGRGNALVSKHRLPDDGDSGLGTAVQVTCLHLASFIVKAGAAISLGEKVGTLGATGASSPHAHCEASVTSSSSPVRTNPWSDICASKYQVGGLCYQDSSVGRPLLTPALASSYIDPMLLIASRANGVSINVKNLVLSPFTVAQTTPAALGWVNLGTEARSLNQAAATGWIAYGILEYVSGTTWQYVLDNNALLLQPGRTYAILPQKTGAGLALSFPASDSATRRALAMYDLVAAAKSANFGLIDPDRLVESPSFAPSTSEYRTFAMPGTGPGILSAEKDASGPWTWWVLLYQSNSSPWTHRWTKRWDPVTRSWSSEKRRGPQFP